MRYEFGLERGRTLGDHLNDVLSFRKRKHVRIDFIVDPCRQVFDGADAAIRDHAANNRCLRLMAFADGIVLSKREVAERIEDRRAAMELRPAWNRGINSLLQFQRLQRLRQRDLRHGAGRCGYRYPSSRVPPAWRRRRLW